MIPPLFLLNSLQIGIGVVQDIGLRRNLWALGDRGHQQMGLGLQDIQDLGYGGEDAHVVLRMGSKLPIGRGWLPAILESQPVSCDRQVTLFITCFYDNL